MGELISFSQANRWRDVLQEFSAHDVYHLPEYFALERDFVGAYLYVYREPEATIAVPFVTRKVPPPLDEEAELLDASSAYGYPGPLLQGPQNIDLSDSGPMYEDLRHTLREIGVISCFLRCHPILSPPGFLRDLAQQTGKTVSIDLTQPIDSQMAVCRKKHRYSYRRALRDGVTVEFDRDLSGIQTFIEIYESRMKSLNASESYFFPGDYYTKLASLLSKNVALMHARFSGEIIASSLFFLHGRGIQYHLSAARPEFGNLSPTLVILETMRRWGIDNGFEWMHLGGGLGGANDSLMQFKSGFGDRRHDFLTLRLITDEDIYRKLCQKHRAKNGDSIAINPNFFPPYRLP